MIKVKKLNEGATLPVKAHEDDAGWDLVATRVNFYEKYIEYGTSLAIGVPKGYYGRLAARSSIRNYDLILSNGTGTLDSGYLGEVVFCFKRLKENGKFYNIGDKIGQLTVLQLPNLELVEVDDLEDSERGEGGFGSSGN